MKSENGLDPFICLNYFWVSHSNKLGTILTIEPNFDVHNKYNSNQNTMPYEETIFLINSGWHDA